MRKLWKLLWLSTWKVLRSVMIVEIAFLLMPCETHDISANDCEHWGSYYACPETSNLLKSSQKFDACGTRFSINVMEDPQHKCSWVWTLWNLIFSSSNFNHSRKVLRSVMIMEFAFLLMQLKAFNKSAHDWEHWGFYFWESPQKCYDYVIHFSIDAT